MRAKFKDDIPKKHNVKLWFMSAFARASVLALKEIPAANASIEGDSIVYRDYVDLSVAVATPKGLVTPVLRNAEAMGFLDIEKGIAELGRKARDGKLTIEDMADIVIYAIWVYSASYTTSSNDLPNNGNQHQHEGQYLHVFQQPFCHNTSTIQAKCLIEISQSRQQEHSFQRRSSHASQSAQTFFRAYGRIEKK